MRECIKANSKKLYLTKADRLATMTYKWRRLWIVVAHIADIVRPVSVQMPIPMFGGPGFPNTMLQRMPNMMPQPIQHPIPLPVPLPLPAPMFPPPMFAAPALAAMPPMPPMPAFPIPCPEIKHKRTTTTTTETPTTISDSDNENIAIAFPVPVPIPMPMPMPVPVPMPAPMPIYCRSSPAPSQPPSRPARENCPPCPPCICKPSCTPKFYSYCSPCHQKCRCNNRYNVPKPKPPTKSNIIGPAYIPIQLPPVPPPIVMVPVPGYQSRHKSSDQADSTCSDESGVSSSCDSNDRKKYRNKKRKYQLRRFHRSLETDNELVKPLLSYVARNGKVKYERKLSNDEAHTLIRKKDAKRKLQKKHGNAVKRSPHQVVLRSAPKNNILVPREHKLVLKRSKVLNRESSDTEDTDR